MVTLSQRCVPPVRRPPYRGRCASRCARARSLGVAALAFHVAHGQFGLGGHGLDGFTYNWVYDGLIIGSALSCLTRGALVRKERLAWLMLGAGLALDATGEVYYTLAFGDSGSPPIPSLADLFYLLYYVCAYAGLVLLVRARIERFSASTWLDGGIAAMTAAAIIAAVAFEPIAHAATQGDAAAIATNFAYPVGDLILLVMVVAALGLSGWRPGRAWLLLAIGLALSAIADTAYLDQSANGTYVVGGLLDSLWMASALAIGLAAWQRPPAKHAFRIEGRRLLVVPTACAIASLGVLLYGGVHHVSVVALALAGAAVMAVFVRATWTFHENAVLLESSRRDAETDALTGLGNRRAMSAALERYLAGTLAAALSVLVMFDLDGFKLYNDRFGHIAGDSLLALLGLRLRESVGEAGAAYRLGGDEFCVLLDCNAAEADRYIAAAVEALCAEGDGFSVGTSYGRVEIPTEAGTSTAALRLADDRMYAQKGGRRGSARQQTHDVLLGVLREREPKLHHHLREVGRLAMLVGRRLQMGDEQLDELRRAAELHDIGKAAVPDAILNKPGRLEPHEWVFMARHTLVGRADPARRAGAGAGRCDRALEPRALGRRRLPRSDRRRADPARFPDRPRVRCVRRDDQRASVCPARSARKRRSPSSSATPARSSMPTSSARSSPRGASTRGSWSTAAKDEAVAVVA